MPDLPPTRLSSHTAGFPLKRSKWWLEPELALLVVFVLGAYFTRMTDLAVRGEESRRGLIAREMLMTGDWIVPRCQGVPLFSRPPLQNWLIALISLARGGVDEVAIRFSSDCAVLLTVILIYAYGRTFLTRLGALTAGTAYASMGQVLELGRLGETDALFTLFVSASLLVWHLCYLRGDSHYLTWCLGYLFVALGMLTKGPQAPVYFAGVVGAYLLWMRNWRFALSRAHLTGIALFLVLFGAWQIPFALQLGAEGAGKMYVNDVGHRFLYATWMSFSTHLVEYPLETLVCLLPWSGLLIVWWNRRFRQTLGKAGTHAAFLAICLLVSFPTVWLPPGSRPRYFMSLYPCVALLAGLVANRVLRTRNAEEWRIVWPIFARGCALAMAGIALAVLVISLGDFNTWLKQPPSRAAAYTVGSLLLAALVWQAPARNSALLRRAGVLSIACFVAASYDTILINAIQRTTVDTAGAVTELKWHLPPHTPLVSFGQLHHLFVFHYHEHVPVREWPESTDEVENDLQYFCVEPGKLAAEGLPFPWEQVADISCDRRIQEHPAWRVIVGRRIDLPATALSAARQVWRKPVQPAVREIRAPLAN